MQAHQIIRETIARIGAKWKAGAKFDADRFRKYDELCQKAIAGENIGRLRIICDRYEQSIDRDLA